MANRPWWVGGPLIRPNEKGHAKDFCHSPKLDTWICDHDRHANIKPKPDINKNQLNFYKSFPLSFHSCFFT